MRDMLVDSFGRRVNYLRISLTDHCNFRCVYCVPPEGFSSVSNSLYLTSQEIARFVSIISKFGVNRIRLTGGEPLLRKDLLDIVRNIKKVPGIEDLSITTNASLLKPLIQPLKEAGLDRINISLDSLDPKRFKEITLSDSFNTVYEATFLSLKAGFSIKLNMVIMKGLTQEEILRFVDLAVSHPIEVRFLEFMPLCGEAWQKDLVVPIQEIRQIVHEHYNLEELPRADNVAQSYSIEGGKGGVGFIASLTESFCASCSRFRLSADGKIFPCLFSHVQVSVKDLLRNNVTDDKIIEAIQLAAQLKPKGNQFSEKPFKETPADFETLSTPLIRQIGG